MEFAAKIIRRTIGMDFSHGDPREKSLRLIRSSLPSSVAPMSELKESISVAFDGKWIPMR